jgi:hypothetical protein
MRCKIFGGALVAGVWLAGVLAAAAQGTAQSGSTGGWYGPPAGSQLPPAYRGGAQTNGSATPVPTQRNPMFDQPLSQPIPPAVGGAVPVIRVPRSRHR